MHRIGLLILSIVVTLSACRGEPPPASEPVPEVAVKRTVAPQIIDVPAPPPEPAARVEPPALAEEAAVEKPEKAEKPEVKHARKPKRALRGEKAAAVAEAPAEPVPTTPAAQL